MNPKIVLGLVLVFSGGSLPCRADATTDIASTNLAQPRSPRVLSLFDVLNENGTKLGCHFTLEYQGFGITSKETKADLNYLVKIKLSADSIPSLVSKLHDYLYGFIVVQDANNPKIVHIIEKVLADDKNYALNKKINLNYSGSLAPTNTPVKPGYFTTVGGLLAAVAEKAGDVRGGSDDSTMMGMRSDSITQVNVKATNETVRSILTDCLPAAKYKPVMWRAVRTTQNGEPCVLIQFFGQKKP